MKNSLTLNEQKRFQTLILESNGLLTEGKLSKILEFIKKRLSPQKIEKIKQDLTDNFGIDENSSKEEIEDILRQKTNGKSSMKSISKTLEYGLGYASLQIVALINSIIGAGVVVGTEFDPIAIVAVIFYVLFSQTDVYDKLRRKVLGPKIDKYLFGRDTKLGDYRDEDIKENKKQKMKKVIRLTESELTRIIKRIVNEQNQQQNITFNENEVKSLSKRGFKFDVKNTVATLQKQGNIEVTKYFQSPTDQYGGYIVKKDGKVVIKKPHDAVDTELDKLIGYNWRTGYSQ